MRHALTIYLFAAALSACGHSTYYRLADRASRWQALEASGCRIGTIEGSGDDEVRCYHCPDGRKVCV